MAAVGTERFTRQIRITALLLTATLSLFPVQPAQAAFPGTNGKIAFVSGRDGNAEIYVMDASGAQQTRLTAVPFNGLGSIGHRLISAIARQDRDGRPQMR
jgi:hypothetical protein